MRIHFICRGNAYRSRIAEAYFNSLQLDGAECISSGTIAEIYSETTRRVEANAQKFLEEKGLLGFAKPHWDQLTQDRIKPEDITVCMNPVVREECLRIVELPEKSITWSIADWDEGEIPATTYEGWLAHTENIYSEIKEKIDDLVNSNRLTATADQP